MRCKSGCLMMCDQCLSETTSSLTANQKGGSRLLLMSYKKIKNELRTDEVSGNPEENGTIYLRVSEPPRSYGIYHSSLRSF